MTYLKEAIGRKPAFNVTLYQTNKTATSATYKVKVNRNGTYFFGMSGSKIMVQHNDGSGYKNIVVASGVDDARDVGKELKRWAFPKLSSWKYDGLYYLYDNGRQNLWGHFYPQWDDKELGFVTGSEIYSKEYTVNIDRGANKKGYKTVKARIDGTSGDFGDVEVTLDLETTEVSPARIKAFQVLQSDVKDKNRKISLSISIENPESYYTLIVKHGNVELFNEIGASEFCIDIPITREMYDSMQTFSATILCANGETEVSETTREIYIEDSGVGITYKANSNNLKEVEEVWYKDEYGNISEVTEVWVKKAKQVVKTIK